ncbi:hypothetical protein A1O3_03915 [Capronia epimyces CBS 606.96]|uniref:D-serine dehydratase n=1 Tax=Capronia epimyces CBS 606.96 TaxID=1182542 RepID=W9YCJ3_9EURO|nr:uncharacterized protein A1O3_03915 [Capronia epimyces CBS 606.96]EXJ86961.1 hypothetical protein A1O3_03915 [Capronia epimyces CBS 606.96]
MDFSLQHHKSFIGRAASELPTPSLVIKRSVLDTNITRLHDDVARLNIAFRPHVKTLKVFVMPSVLWYTLLTFLFKSIEVTRKMLQNGKHRKIVASTVAEIRGVLPLAEEGLLDECLYGLPVCPSALPQLHSLSQHVGIALMIDNEQHIHVVEDFRRRSPSASIPWKVFIKIDVGSHRAGVQTKIPRLHDLVRRAEASDSVEVVGFYCHAGHSYACRTQEDAEGVLREEISGCLEGASLIGGQRPIVISVGATPTAHVVQSLQATLPSHVSLELHAGNFPTNDLQQVSTGLVKLTDQAVRICVEVCSVYPERNEVLVNAGVIALSREASEYPGFGMIADHPGWFVVRLSQEHGILGHPGDVAINDGPGEKASADSFFVGQKLFVYCQHTCITAAAFHVYYIVGDDDVVEDTWVPWKGW